MNLYGELFVSFFKVGILTFGGGYAMLPIAQKEVVENRGWIDNEELMDYYAVGQCLPGIIAVNTALFVGHKVKGRAGGIAASLGVVTPSLLIIMVIAAFLQNFLEYEIVEKAFFGVRVVVCALIVQAIIKLWKTAVKNKFGLCVYVATLLLALFTSLPTVLLVVLAVAAGILYHLYGERKAKL